MLKKTLAALLVLAGLASATEITFTDNPRLIDEDDEYFGTFLPNTGCRAMAEFMNPEEPHYGDMMVIDLCKNVRLPYVPGKRKSCSIWYSIWDATEDEWDEFVGTGQGAVFLGEAIPSITDYSQLPNASIYSSNDGVIHMGGWFKYPHVAYAYSKYQCVNDAYSWFGKGDGDDNSYNSAMYFWDQEKQRFGQVMQPTFYVNERSIPTSSVVPTFFVNGHDCEDIIFKAGFYLQTLTDPTYEGQWNDPIVISPQTFGNMGFSSVTGDQSGKLHIFWESSINTGYANFAWQSTFAAIVQNELYYANCYNGQLSQITQLTNNYATSGGEEFIGVNIISSDVDSAGNVYALYELITTDYPYSNITDISIGLVKLSSNGGVIFPPGLFEDISDPYQCYSPQIQIDSEGIAHFVFIVQNGTYKDLYYGNFDTQSLMRPVFSLEDLTLVSDYGQQNTYFPAVVGVGHLFVDSQRRIHFLWNYRPEGNGETSPPPVLYYRRSETFCNANLSPERHSVSNAQTALQSGPAEFYVEDAFPNPASDAITFSYSLPEALRVTIKVYDISGRLVAVPLDEVQSVGRHNFEWDVRSQAGLANGLYLYTLKAGENVQTKRLVIGR